MEPQCYWESILLARSEELISGGRFICLNFGIDEKGQDQEDHNSHHEITTDNKLPERIDQVTRVSFRQNQTGRSNV